MSTEVNIHAAQTKILRELLFQPSSGYAKLQKPTGLSSDHFNFHINRLLNLGLVEKISRGIYRLTPIGKEYANRLDTDNNTIERQPKTAVIIGVERIHNGKTEYLFQERLKNPYFGFWGLPSGKIRWGETLIEAAERECMEETGLTADFRVASIYHEHAVQLESGKIIEDKIFFIMHGVKPRGELFDDFEGGHNEWMTVKTAMAQPKKYQTLKAEVEMLHSDIWFYENTVSYNDQEF